MALNLVESGMDDYATAVITERDRQKRLAVTVDCHSKTEIVRHSPVKLSYAITRNIRQHNTRPSTATKTENVRHNKESGRG